MFKDEFLRTLAARSGLSLKDSREIWKEVEKIFAECIEKREDLDIRGLGHLKYIKLPTRTGFDLSKNEKVQLPEAEKAIFKLSRNLRDLMISDPTKRKIYQTRQAELRRAGLLEEGEDAEDENDENDDEEIIE